MPPWTSETKLPGGEKGETGVYQQQVALGWEFRGDTADPDHLEASKGIPVRQRVYNLKNGIRRRDMRSRSPTRAQGLILPESLRDTPLVANK